MKNSFLAGIAILTFAVATSFTSAWAQTTEEGPAPSDQPSAPMEMGQEQAPQAPPQTQMQGQYQGGGGPNAAEAQLGGPSGEDPAKTDQGVARISMMHGDVSTQRGDSGDWSAATLNQPVMGGDKVSTGDGARAEIQLDFANILRLGTASQANISNFTHKNIQIQLAKGLATYTVFKDSEAEPEIDTPNVSVHPSHHDGEFRVEVQADGDTLVTVRKGEAQISTPQGSTEVHAGEMATIRGSSTEAQYKISQAPDKDDWDRWNSDRDRIIQNAQSWHHTNRYYTGSEDLDAYGHWQNAPDYGQVWVPNEPDGWVPYRDGNWTWEPSYGWTWVGYEPWGWAPYHYGRWMYYGNSWAWWPGPVFGGGFYRPFWAPAYVSFFGWGGGFGFGVGFGWGGWGGFGWLPIGPCDRFFPWWGGYGGRFGFVGVRGGGFGRFGGFAPLHGGTRFSNIARINDVHVGHALSTVNAGRFGAGRVSAVAATRAQISGARMATGNLPVVPSHASLSASGRAAAPSTMHSTASQHFFSNTRGSSTAMAGRQSFQQQTAHLQQSMQQNHVSGVQAGGGRMSSGAMNESRGAASAGMKPSAGMAMSNSSRETGNAGSRNFGGQNVGGQNNRSFTPPNSSNTRSSSSLSQTQRGTAAGSGNNGGFRPFTPPSHNEVPSGAGTRGSSSFGGTSRGPESSHGPESMNRSSGSSGNYWSRTAPSSSSARSYESGSSASRSYGSTGRSYSDGFGRGSSRPQLNMHQPVVQPRSSGSYGGYHGSPSYGGSSSHGSYGGGSHSAPSSGGGSHGGGGGGGHSSGGGHGGGGHH